METNVAFRLKKEHSEQEFLRAVAVHLAQKDETPTDIFESTFDKVKEVEKQYVMIEGDVEVNYSCSVGYDRKEEYYEKVKKYDAGKQEYYYVDEKKTRTVTDWQAHTGTANGQMTVIVANTATQKDCRTEREVATCIDTTHPDYKEAAEEMNVKENAKQEAVNQSVSNCFYGVRLPGDHQKDKNYSGSLKINKMTGLYLPEYQMAYTYQGKKYQTEGFACGDMQENVDYPSIAADVEKEAKKAARPIKIAGWLAVIVGVVLNLFMEDIGSWCLVGYGSAIVALIVYKKVKGKKMKSLYHEKRQQKMAALEKFLAKNKLKALTKKEINTLNQ